ncbi:MAG: RNA methyltransferase [Paludibacteraceae bacterium]|nr:RNA methyltransferase [Paludibacteraceae bacterium]
MKKLETEEIIRISTEEFKKASKTPLVVVLDHIRSLNNVGSIFRTCDAYRTKRMVLCGITATPPNAEIHKSALGAEFSVDWVHYEDTLEAINDLKREGYTIIAIEQATDSTMLDDFVPAKDARYAIIMGNEVNGVQQEAIDMADLCIELPQYGTKHSLNVAVTAGIVIYNLTMKMIR